MKFKILMLSDVNKLNLLYDSVSHHKKNCLLGNKNNKQTGAALLTAGWLLTQKITLSRYLLAEFISIFVRKTETLIRFQSDLDKYLCSLAGDDW